MCRAIFLQSTLQSSKIFTLLFAKWWLPIKAFLSWLWYVAKKGRGQRLWALPTLMTEAFVVSLNRTLSLWIMPAKRLWTINTTVHYFNSCLLYVRDRDLKWASLRLIGQEKETFQASHYFVKQRNSKRKQFFELPFSPHQYYTSFQLWHKRMLKLREKIDEVCKKSFWCCQKTCECCWDQLLQ